MDRHHDEAARLRSLLLPVVIMGVAVVVAVVLIQLMQGAFDGAGTR